MLPTLAAWSSLFAIASLLPAQAPSIAWQFDLASARARAAEEKKPLFLVFRCEP